MLMLLTVSKLCAEAALHNRECRNHYKTKKLRHKTHYMSLSFDTTISIQFIIPHYIYLLILKQNNLKSISSQWQIAWCSQPSLDCCLSEGLV